MIIPLDGDRDGDGWQLREALGETWRWYIDSPHEANSPGWWPARVPGSVVTDLWHADQIPDPYRGYGSRASEWTGTRSWVYRRTVLLPDSAAREPVTLELDGVDPSGTVYWDGHLLGRIEGLYRRARFAIADAIPGTHRLAIVVDPVPPSQPQVGRTDLVRVHRPRMNEGWDFCPRFPHQGIWRDARVVIAPVQLAQLSVRTELDTDGTGRVFVAAAIEVADDREVPAAVRLLDSDGHLVAEHNTTIAGGERSRTLSIALAVVQPELWWPRGFGAAVTYTLALLLGDADEPVARRTVGFRRASLMPNADAQDDALPYTAVVNDTVVPLVGWNWVPVDAQYGAVTLDRVRHLVELAAESGARVLRVWGGGLIETEEFYDACDRVGLLVWQEFSQSSSGIASEPASDPEFVAMMTDEARSVVPQRTHHPSLFLWCGGNELHADEVPLTEERSPVLAALRATVIELDPGRSWLPTSPSGPAFHNRADVIAAAPQDQHDVHGPWEHQGLRAQYTLCNAGTSLAHTEFGVEGMTNPRALHQLVPESQRWPADRSNPIYRHLGDWWNNAELVQASFGQRLTDLDALQRASQLLQATGLGYAVEADRRRFPRCSIVLPWQFAESYPNAWCTSSVDHLGEPKPAFHAVARAFAAERVSVRVPTAVWAGERRLTAQAWVWSESGRPAGTQVVGRLRSADGAVLAEGCWSIAEAVDNPRAVSTLSVDASDVPSDAVVVWDVSWHMQDGAVIDREVVLACTGADFAPLLDLEPATLAVTMHAEAGTFVIEAAHRNGPVIVGLQVRDQRPPDATGWLVASGDPRPLLPGETRTFTLRPSHAAPPYAVQLEAWNTDTVQLVLQPDLDKEFSL